MHTSNEQIVTRCWKLVLCHQKIYHNNRFALLFHQCMMIVEDSHASSDVFMMSFRVLSNELKLKVGHARYYTKHDI